MASFGTTLTTKLIPPTKRSGLIERPQLTSRVEGLAEQKLVLACAPAGYGKSVVLRGVELDVAGHGSDRPDHADGAGRAMRLPVDGSLFSAEWSANGGALVATRARPGARSGKAFRQRQRAGACRSGGGCGDGHYRHP